MEFTTTIETNAAGKQELVIRAPIGSLERSASGKTLVVASSRGNHATTAVVNGVPVTVGFNAYIKPSK